MNLRKDGCLFPGMSKRVNLPPHFWLPTGSESLVQPPQSKSHLVDYGQIVGGRFVVHAPAAADEFQTTCLRHTLFLK